MRLLRKDIPKSKQRDFSKLSLYPLEFNEAVALLVGRKPVKVHCDSCGFIGKDFDYPIGIPCPKCELVKLSKL